MFIFKLTLSFQIYKYFKSIYLDKTFDNIYFLVSLGNTCMTSYTFEVMNKFWDRRNSFILFLLGNVNKYKYIVCVACNKNMLLILNFKNLDQMLGIIYLTFAFTILYVKSSSFFLLSFQNFALIELALPRSKLFLRYNFIFSRIVRFPHIFEKRYIKQLKDTIKNIVIWWFVRSVVSWI